MRFAGVKELKHQTMDILNASQKEDIIITAYGKPLAILYHVTEEDLADYLIENAPSFKERVKEAADKYITHGGITADALIKRLERRHGSNKV